jgi:hypothetical protein
LLVELVVETETEPTLVVVEVLVVIVQASTMKLLAVVLLLNQRFLF